MNITLVEFDIGTEWNRYQITLDDTEVLWVNYAPGIWVTSVDGDFSYFDSDLIGTTPEYSIGDTGPAGGVIFYIDTTTTPDTVYESWTADEAGTYQFKTSDTAGGGSGTAIGTGYSNTYTDVGDDADYPAFKACIDATRGGYSDWFLPSKDELNELYKEKVAVGGFDNVSYWSSSEVNSSDAWALRFGDGVQFGTSKSFSLRVRAVRAFTAAAIPFPWYSDVASTEDVSGYVTRVGSVFVDTERAPSTVDLAALLDLGELGFFWDDINRLLYIKFPSDNAPELYNITVGLAELISDKEYVDEINNRIYDPELISLPNISKTIDPLFFGKIQFNDVNIQLHNNHGRYDDIGSFDVYGGEVRVLYGDATDVYTDFRRVWTGYIDDFTVSESECAIRASDSRKLLERPVPVSFFSQDVYADLSDRDDGKPIPIHYGKVIGFNPICIDAEADHTTADYNFKLCDTSLHDGIFSVDEVRYKGDVISSTDNLTTAIITLAYATIQDDNGRVDFRDIEVDFHGVQESGTAIENGLDVIADMIDKYAGIPFSDVRYDETKWNTVTATMPDIGLSIEKDSTIAQQIERVAASLRIQFDVQGDGRYTVRVFDQTAVPSITINEDQLLGPIQAVYSSDEFASRLYVDYIGGVLRYTENEQEIINRYKTTKPAEFDTVLTSATDATDFAADIMSLVADFPPLINIAIPIDDAFEIEDNVYAILNRISGRWFGRMKCRVEGVQYDFDNENITLSLRAFESMADVVVPVYRTVLLTDTDDLLVLDDENRSIWTIIEVEEVTLLDTDDLVMLDTADRIILTFSEV